MTSCWLKKFEEVYNKIDGTTIRVTHRLYVYNIIRSKLLCIEIVLIEIFVIS